MPKKFLLNNPDLKDRRRGLRKTQTEAEKAFWAQVRNQQFHGLKFFCQYSVGPYILDFYCPAINLAIELDGGQHNDPDGRRYDAVRSNYLKGHDIDVLRFWDHEVLLDMHSVLVRLEERVTPPASP